MTWKGQAGTATGRGTGFSTIGRLMIAEAFGQDVGKGRILIRQKVSQSDVAAMAGIARENVSRILNDWIRDKLVSRLSGYYCLEDRAKLQRESGM